MRLLWLSLQKLAKSSYLGNPSRPIASGTAAAYYGRFMLTAGVHPSNGWLACWFALFAFFAELCLIPRTLNAQQPEILPLSQVKPGMQGYAYTIFTGDKIEKFDLEVL